VGAEDDYTQLRLAPLGKAEAEEFLNILLGEYRSLLPRRERPVLSPVEGDRERVSDTPLHALKQLILDKTQGTPFFMEEVVQELREQGVLEQEIGGGAGLRPAPTAKPLTDLHIPPTVQGVLAARIDRLASDEKALLQQLAVIGRQFPVSLVKQVITQPEEELYRLLASLQRKEFLYEQPAFPEVEYLFKHALTQEVAYGTVLQERRKLLHARTAQAIEALFAARLEDHYSELAHHYSRRPALLWPKPSVSVPRTECLGSWPAAQPSRARCWCGKGRRTRACDTYRKGSRPWTRWRPDYIGQLCLPIKPRDMQS
jgi:predicted ATPase